MDSVYLFMIILIITILGTIYFEYVYYMGNNFYMGFPKIK